MPATIIALPARPVRRGTPPVPADPSQTYVPAGNMIRTAMSLIETALRAYHVLPHGNAAALEALLLGQSWACINDLANLLEAEKIYVLAPKGTYDAVEGRHK